MACCYCCKPADDSVSDWGTWARKVVEDAVNGYKVTAFVDSNNSTCGLLMELLVSKIGVDVYVVEIDKMEYKPIEWELEQRTGCRIVGCLIIICMHT